MSLVFPQRIHTPERMDIETYTVADARRILSALEHINLWLGGNRATLQHLERFSKTWKSSDPVRIIDWGTGGADLPRAIIRWARKTRFRLSIVGIDNNALVADYAREACKEYPEIEIRLADATAFPQTERFDYAISSLTLHHLSDEQIVELLRESDRVATRGIIMNDLKRSARAWMWIWLISRLFRTHPIVQHDGPLSVKRAFTIKELMSFAHRAGFSYLQTTTHFGYRLTLAGEKVKGHPPQT